MYNFCKNRQNHSRPKTEQHSVKNRSDIGVRSEDDEMKRKTRRRKRKRYEYFKRLTAVRLIIGILGNTGRVKRKGNEAPNTLVVNEK